MFLVKRKPPLFRLVRLIIKLSFLLEAVKLNFDSLFLFTLCISTSLIGLKSLTLQLHFNKIQQTANCKLL